MYNWAPGEMLYAMECAGDLPTRTGKINKFILDYLQDKDNGIESLIAELDGLNMKEVDYINQEIQSRSPRYVQLIKNDL